MDGAIVQVASDRVVYRASALGGCVKGLAAARMGYEEVAPPQKQQDVFDEGHLHEGAVLEKFEKDGWQIVEGSLQREVVVPVTGKLFVVGHVDAEMFGPIDEYFATTSVVDVKSQSQNAWDDFERNGWESGFFPKYKWQFSSYMIATGLPGMLIRKNRNTGEVKHEFIEEPFYSLTEIRVRVMQVEAIAKQGALPGPCDYRTFPCGYFYLHEDEPVVVLEDDQLDVLARQYEEAKDEEKQARGRKEDTRKALRAGMAGIDKATTKLGTKISFYMQKNPPRLNEERMIEDGIDVEKYKEQGESERLRITLPKDG